jgi:diguanylate cyclase (GGDEF)-like protein/PAS domain S-box-containing protein
MATGGHSIPQGRSTLMVKTADDMSLGWAVLDSLDSRIVVLDRTAGIVAANAAWRSFAAGQDKATFGVGGNFLAVCRTCTDSDYGLAAKKGITRVLDGTLPEFSMDFPFGSGNDECWFLLRAGPLRLPDSDGAVVSFAEITDRHRAEAGLLHEHRRFTSLIKHTDALINVVDVDGTITYKSPALDSILGEYSQGLAVIDVFDLIHHEDVDALRQALMESATLESGTICQAFRMRRGDGLWRWIESTFTNLLDDPDVGGILVSSRDITDRKEAETVLAQQAESFATVFHATAEAMLIHDGTVFVAVNQAYANLSGLEPDQMVGKPLIDFVAPGSHEAMAERIRQGSETPYDLVAQRADGSTYFAEILGRQIQYGGRSLRLVTVRDVTQDRAEQEALRASEARQALLLDLAKTLREMQDPNQMLSMASEALGRFLNTHRVWFFEMADDAMIVATAGWTDGTLPPLGGTVPIHPSEYGYSSELRAGHIVRISDVRNAPRIAPTGKPELGARAGIAVPLQRGGRWNAGLFVGHASVREWTDDEVALARDVAEQTWDAVERGRAEAALRAREARFRALVHHSSDIVVVFNATGGLTYASPALERILGYSLDTYAESLRLDLVHAEDRDGVVRTWAQAVDNPGSGFRVAYRTLNAEDVWIWLDAHVTNLLHEPEVGGIVMNVRDITEQKRLESELRHLALHDPLTGLPNRTLLADRMDQALRQAAEDGKRVGLLFVDLNDFKQINDAFGHEAGDGLLHEVAERLRSMTRGAETVARLGGDEFVLLLPGIEEVRHILRFAERVKAAMTAPFICRDRKVPIGVTIGIAVSEPGLLKPEVLLRDGDAAMYRAKQTKRGHFLVHASGMAENAMRRWRLKTDVAEAADRGELVMHYQPIVTLASGAVSGMEALLRWQHPMYGMVPPDEFIPIAEEAGQIVALGRWGITQVCKVLSRWGPDSPFVSLNFSATQFSNPGLLGDIARLIARSAIDPQKLRLEITEQIMIEDLAGTVATLTQLRDLGVGVAIDDFGSGYSSLRYLRELPVTAVKLDRSFMHGMETDPGALAMVSGIITIAHAIGLSVTAEGIETAGQLALMQGIGCDQGQGFYLGRPAPAPADPLDRIEIAAASPRASNGTGTQA